MNAPSIGKMICRSIVAAHVFLSATAWAAACRADNPIFPEGAKVEMLHARRAMFNSGLTEGPAVAPDGSIDFTNMPFGTRSWDDPPVRPGMMLAGLAISERSDLCCRGP